MNCYTVELFYCFDECTEKQFEQFNNPIIKYEIHH